MMKQSAMKRSALTFMLWVLTLFSPAWQGSVLAGDTIQLYYEENAQVELIIPEGTRVLIDVHDPSALSSPPTDRDVLLTTHNHGDHRRLNFITTFPGQQLDMTVGQIKLPGVTLQGIASTHHEGDEFKDRNGSNYIFIIEMAGLRIAHFGDIGQKELTPDQLKVLGRVDIAITQLANSYSGMNAQNKMGFNLMDQLNPKLIIPTHLNDAGLSAKMAAEKWIGFESYKKFLTLGLDHLPAKTTIIFMGRNAEAIKLPYSNY